MKEEGIIMKCPPCKNVSFDFLEVCKKCWKNLVEIKAKHNILTFTPTLISTGDADFNIAYPTNTNSQGQILL